MTSAKMVSTHFTTTKTSSAWIFDTPLIEHPHNLMGLGHPDVGASAMLFAIPPGPQRQPWIAARIWLWAKTRVQYPGEHPRNDKSSLCWDAHLQICWLVDWPTTIYNNSRSTEASTCVGLNLGSLNCQFYTPALLGSSREIDAIGKKNPLQIQQQEPHRKSPNMMQNCKDLSGMTIVHHIFVHLARRTSDCIITKWR